MLSAESILPNSVLKKMVVKPEVTFCVHESCDPIKCGVKEEPSFPKRIVEKLKTLFTCGKYKQEDDMNKIRLPGNSRSQFVDACQKIKDRRTHKKTQPFHRRSTY